MENLSSSISAEDWRNVMGLPNLSDVDAEHIINMAIALLNVYDCALSEMSGTAGTKTVTLTSKQKGGVFLVARVIYYSMYQGIEHTSGVLNVASPDLMANAEVMKTVREVAQRLQVDEDTRIPFIVATDESGLT